MPGDTLTTTCDYKSSVVFGAESTSEQCYLFTLHYPHGTLSNGDTAIHSQNACLGSPLDNFP